MTLAYWCIFFAIFLPIFCAAYAKYRAGFSPADNHNPRAFLARAQGKAARADAAQQQDRRGMEKGRRIGFIYCYISDKATLRSAMFGVNLLCIVALFIAAI